MSNLRYPSYLYEVTIPIFSNFSRYDTFQAQLELSQNKKMAIIKNNFFCPIQKFLTLKKLGPSGSLVLCILLHLGGGMSYSGFLCSSYTVTIYKGSSVEHWNDKEYEQAFKWSPVRLVETILLFSLEYEY